MKIRPKSLASAKEKSHGEWMWKWNTESLSSCFTAWTKRFISVNGLASYNLFSLYCKIKLLTGLIVRWLRNRCITSAVKPSRTIPRHRFKTRLVTKASWVAQLTMRLGFKLFCWPIATCTARHSRSGTFRAKISGRSKIHQNFKKVPKREEEE